MSAGKLTVIGLALAMIGGLALALYITSELDYEPVDGLTEITIGDQKFAVSEYVGTDNPENPIRLLGCFKIKDPSGAVKAGRPTLDIEPRASINRPGCKKPSEIRSDVATSKAVALVAERIERERAALVRIVVVYPDGQGYQWREVERK